MGRTFRKICLVLPAALICVAGGALVFSATAQVAPQASGATTVEGSGAIADAGRDRIVITGMVPIPDVGEGAPRFTAKDVERIEKDARNITTKVSGDIRRCDAAARFPTPCDPMGNKGLPGLLACEKEHAIKVGNLAGKAAEATHAAENVRRLAATGGATTAEVEAAELVRQQAVNKMESARDRLVEARADVGAWQVALLSNPPPFPSEDPANAYQREKHGQLARDRLLTEQARRVSGNAVGLSAPGHLPGLSISGVSAHGGDDKRGEFVVLRGEITNNGDKAVSVPPLAGILLDERGWVVQQQIVRPSGRKRIKAGGVYPFGFEVRPAPSAMERALVMFAADAPPERIGVGLHCPSG